MVNTKIKTWFEVGEIAKDAPNGETRTIFDSDVLNDCIQYWKDNNLNKQDNFIDVWEQEGECTPEPIANIDVSYFLKG